MFQNINTAKLLQISHRVVNLNSRPAYKFQSISLIFYRNFNNSFIQNSLSSFRFWRCRLLVINNLVVSIFAFWWRWSDSKQSRVLIGVNWIIADDCYIEEAIWSIRLDCAGIIKSIFATIFHWLNVYNNFMFNFHMLASNSHKNPSNLSESISYLSKITIKNSLYFLPVFQTKCFYLYDLLSCSAFPFLAARGFLCASIMYIFIIFISSGI